MNSKYITIGSSLIREEKERDEKFKTA
jgi:hypothetical protein